MTTIRGSSKWPSPPAKYPTKIDNKTYDDILLAIVTEQRQCETEVAANTHTYSYKFDHLQNTRHTTSSQFKW